MQEACKNNAVISSVGLHEPTLEDVFLKFTGKKMRAAVGASAMHHHDDAREETLKQDLYAIYSIWLREMLRFFRLKSRLVGSVASPFFFLVFLGMGFGTAAAMPGISQGAGYVSFLTPGIIGMTLLFSSTFAGLSVLWDREFGFLKEIMVAPVSRLAIVLGRTCRRRHYRDHTGNDHTAVRDLTRHEGCQACRVFSYPWSSWSS